MTRKRNATPNVRIIFLWFHFSNAKKLHIFGILNYCSFQTSVNQFSTTLLLERIERRLLKWGPHYHDQSQWSGATTICVLCCQNRRCLALIREIVMLYLDERSKKGGKHVRCVWVRLYGSVQNVPYVFNKWQIRAIRRPFKDVDIDSGWGSLWHQVLSYWKTTPWRQTNGTTICHRMASM